MNKEVIIDIENPKDNDLISRQAALEPYRILNNTDTLCVAVIRANIMQLPSVNPQEQAGHWIGDKAYPICPKCNCNIIEEYISCSDYAEMYKPMKYCPNCGCQMVKLQESSKEWVNLADDLMPIIDEAESEEERTEVNK